MTPLDWPALEGVSSKSAQLSSMTGGGFGVITGFATAFGAGAGSGATTTAGRVEVTTCGGGGAEIMDREGLGDALAGEAALAALARMTEADGEAKTGSSMSQLSVASMSWGWPDFVSLAQRKLKKDENSPIGTRKAELLVPSLRAPPLRPPIGVLADLEANRAARGSTRGGAVSNPSGGAPKKMRVS